MKFAAGLMILPALALGGTVAAASAMASPYHLFSEPEPGTIDNVAYTECADPEIWHECVSMTLGCSEDGGWFELFDGGAIATRVLGDVALPELTFTVGTTAFSKSGWNLSAWHNDMDGGWVVRFDRLDTHDLFDALRDHSGPIAVTVAATTFDLTPRLEDRPLLRRLAAACGTPSVLPPLRTSPSESDPTY